MAYETVNNFPGQISLKETQRLQKTDSYFIKKP